mmetsp:Transcript_50032/g.99408  ORF Transcript_50032/g.99408 Transcript_50032/m.99408 type:complete len:200 (-) Transcript_50032:2024-2623(-)
MRNGYISRTSVYPLRPSGRMRAASLCAEGLCATNCWVVAWMPAGSSFASSASQAACVAAHRACFCRRSSNGSPWPLPTTRRARPRPSVPMISTSPSCMFTATVRSAAISSRFATTRLLRATVTSAIDGDDSAPRRRFRSEAFLCAACRSINSSSAREMASSASCSERHVAAAPPVTMRSHKDENLARASVSGEGSSRPA